MLRRQGLVVLFCAVVLTGILRSPAGAAAQEEGKVAGILIDKKDTWITVKADGDKEPVKYVLGGNPSKKLTDTFKTVFNASRVTLTYKTVGDERQLLSIKRQVLKNAGTVTGVFVKMYDNFWIEIKPKDGPANAFAPGFNNFKDKAFMDTLRSLKPGDVVTIAY